jgi:hypothetical protein
VIALTSATILTKIPRLHLSAQIILFQTLAGQELAHQSPIAIRLPLSSVIVSPGLMPFILLSLYSSNWKFSFFREAKETFVRFVNIGWKLLKV